MPDIPRSDAEFDVKWTAFMSYVSANLLALGINPLDPEWTNLVAAKTDWDSKYPAHITGQQNPQSLAAAKDTSRGTGQGLWENLIQIMRANKTDVSDAELEAAGLSLYDTVRTPSPVPTTRPVMILDTSERFRHGINYADEGTPTSKARPAGVRGIELRLFVGPTPPPDPLDYEFVGEDTKTPQIWTFDPSEAGQMAHWVGRWLNTRSEPGPWSDVVSAVVPG